jgi:hypothetical protein
VLSLLNGLGYPDEGAGTNDQGLCLFCEGDNCGGLVRHDDQFRGVSHAYVDRFSGAVFRYVSPDYFRLVPWEGDGLQPVGYGYDSIAANLSAVLRVNAAGAGLDAASSLTARQDLLQKTDDRGIIATPANSYINELVTEAARLSITQNGRHVQIEYGATPAVRPREAESQV